MSVPWSDGKNVAMGSTKCSASGANSSEFGRQFVDRRSDVHETYVRECEKTKRLGYALAAGLLALACIIPVVAPQGRETISWMLSACLFVFAAGSMGYTNIWLKMKKREMMLRNGQT
jgi:hypothetical protein